MMRTLLRIVMISHGLDRILGGETVYDELFGLFIFTAFTFDLVYGLNLKLREVF